MWKWILLIMTLSFRKSLLKYDVCFQQRSLVFALEKEAARPQGFEEINV